MNFLAPLFLLGAAAIALPVAFHLIRRNTRQRLLFSSLLFLQPTPPRMRERSRLEDLLLLALRCAVIALLALAFARPFLRRDTLAEPAAAAGSRTVLLVDTSASMRRAGLWDAALRRAESALGALGPADQASVVAYGRDAATLVSFEAWNTAPPGSRTALALDRLKATGPGWSATHLDQALVQAADLLLEGGDEKFKGPRRIVLVTDLQEGSRLERLQSYDWPKAVAVEFQPIAPARPGNAGLQLLTDTTALAGSTSAVVRVRISNDGDARNDRFEVFWARPGSDAPAAPPLEVRVAPGGSRVARVEVPQGLPVDRLVLRGDDDPFDNTAHVVPPTVGNSRLLYLGAEDPADPKEPLFFLRRAFPATNQVGVSVDARKPDGPLGPPDFEPAGLVLAGGGISPSLADTLRLQARDNGKTVLFVVRGPESAAPLARLLDVPTVAIEEVRPASYAMLGEVDLRHPLLAPFADPRFGDFTKIRIWRHRRVGLADLPGMRVPIRFDTGEPALAEATLGKGRILVLATGWHPADSQLALSSKFVPLLYSMLESGGGGLALTPPAYVVSDELPLPTPATAGSRLTLPDGAAAALEPGATRFAATLTPGTYTLEPGLGTRPIRFAVNLDPAESRTSPMAVEDLERLGVLFRVPSETRAPDPDRTRQLAAAEAESRQKLWRWALVATLFFILFETALAGRMTRQSTPPGGVPA